VRLLLFCETAVDLPLGHGDISGTLRHIQVVYSHSQWRYACMLLYKEERQRLPSEPTPTSIHPIINLNLSQRLLVSPCWPPYPHPSSEIWMTASRRPRCIYELRLLFGRRLLRGQQFRRCRCGARGVVFRVGNALELVHGSLEIGTLIPGARHGRVRLFGLRVGL